MIYALPHLKFTGEMPIVIDRETYIKSSSELLMPTPFYQKKFYLVLISLTATMAFNFSGCTWFKNSMETTRESLQRTFFKSPRVEIIPWEISTPASKRDLDFAARRFHSGQYQVAEYYLKKSLLVSPDNITALKLLPWAQFYQKKYREALIGFENARSRSPQDPQPLVGMGWAYISMRSFESALEKFQKAQTLAPNSFQVKKGLGFSHLFLHQGDRAQEIFSEIYLNHEWVRLMSQWEQWKENFPEKLIEVAPSSAEVPSLFTLDIESPRYPSMLYAMGIEENHEGLNRGWRLFRKELYQRALDAFESLPQEFAESLDAKNGQAWSLLNTGKIFQAWTLFKEIQTEAPGFIGGVVGIRQVQGRLKKKAAFAKYYFDLHKLRISEDKFTDLVRGYPAWAYPVSMLGWIQLERGNESKAAEFFFAAMALDSNEPAALDGMKRLKKSLLGNLFKGEAALQSQDYKTASYYFWEYIEANHQPSEKVTSGLAKAHYGLGLSQLEKHQYESALENFNKVLTHPAFQFEGAKGSGLAHYYLNQFDNAAKNLITADALRPGLKELALPLNWSILMSWNRTAALEFFQKRVENYPLQASAFMGLGWIHYKNGQPDLGVEYLLTSISLDPEMVFTEDFKNMLERERFGWQIHNHLGWVHYQRQNYQESLNRFTAALEKNQRSSEALKGLGYTHYKIGNRTAAKTFLMQCIARNPDTRPFKERVPGIEPDAEIELLTNAHTLLAQIYLDEKNYEKALGLYSKESIRHPDWPVVQAGLGWSLLNLNRLDESQEAFQRAVRQQPLNPNSHKGLLVAKFLIALKNM